MKVMISILITILSVCLYANDKSSAVQEKVVEVVISQKGFVPAQITLLPKQNLTLKITRTTDKTCMTELKNLDGSGVTSLPLNKVTTFKVGSFDQPQKVKLLCGMGMVAGLVTVGQ